MDILSKSKNLNNLCDSVEFDQDQNREIYKMIINNKRYIFKPASKEMGIPSYETIFNELVVSYLAKYLDINCVDVSIASYNATNSRFKKEYGILMEDYNLKGYVAFLGSYFLEQYYEHLKNVGKLSITGLDKYTKDEALSRMNNFKSIYVAITYFFSDYKEKNIVIDNLIMELSKMICLDYLTMQNDRYMDNWGILLSVSKPPIFIKMHDNELAFSENFEPKLKILNNDETREETLLSFLNLSEKHKECFLDLYNTLTVEKFCEILDEVEEENGNFPKSHKNYKKDLIKRYEKNYNEISEIFEKANIESRNSYAR